MLAPPTHPASPKAGPGEVAPALGQSVVLASARPLRRALSRAPLTARATRTPWSAYWWPMDKAELALGWEDGRGRRRLTTEEALAIDEALVTAAESGRPVLGICLGLQLLFESSTELGGSDGLGLLEGEVAEIPAGGRKIPHIGWAPVTWHRPSRLGNGIRPGEPFYFVHSFVVEPREEDLIGSATYGGEFACVAGRDRIYGVQFHPEKSSAAGLRVLENFVGICAEAGE